jgi:hypothetical protein
MTGERLVEGVISAAVVERPGDEPRDVADPLYLALPRQPPDRW